MGKVELKPCPYCGSDAELREHWGDCSRGPLWWEVECKNPDCGRCQDSSEEAIAAWNKRPDADYRALETEVTNLRMAVGLATTCAPKLAMNSDDPIGMMQEVCNEFRALEAEKNSLRESIYNHKDAISDREITIYRLERKLAALVAAAEEVRDRENDPWENRYWDKLQAALDAAKEG